MSPPRYRAATSITISATEAKICGNVVFEFLFADVVPEVLRTWDFNDANAAKGFKGIVSESSAAGVTADSAVHVAGRKPSETHGAGLDAPRPGAKNIFLAYRARDDHFEKCFGKLLQWKQPALFGSFP